MDSIFTSYSKEFRPLRKDYSFSNLKPAATISLILILHFSALVLISNVDFKEYTARGISFGHDTGHIGLSSITNIIRTRKRFINSNKIRWNGLDIKFKKSPCSNMAIKKFCGDYPLYSPSQLIYTSIEFRPPPVILS